MIDNLVAEPPRRDSLNLTVESYVLAANEPGVFRITTILDLESVVGVHLATGLPKVLRVAELEPVRSVDEYRDIGTIEDKAWLIAESRYRAIAPLLSQGSFSRDDVKLRATEIGVSASSLYRWIGRYREDQLLSSLIPRKRGWVRGHSRISPQQVDLVESVIDSFYLTDQRHTPEGTFKEVARQCLELGVPCPGRTAVNLRLSLIDERRRMRCRGYKERAKTKFQPAPGHFPNADFPLAVVQIDHTPADIILVDDALRKPIGRPWITLATDVYSRMVTGIYISLDPPSEASVAMCVANSIAPKEEWLLRHQIDAYWHVWGVPRTIHVDNGADFRSDTFRKSCLMYGINLEFRPVKQPQYGGHIERLLGTLLNEIHALPGSTFSSVKKRDGYNSQKKSALTLAEFEEWFITLICKVYHERVHSALNSSPRMRWEHGLLAQGHPAPPARPVDSKTILLDFMPMFSRAVLPVGVSIGGMRYYAEALRPWIGSVDEHGKTRRCIFRRDPRDISSIWFFDPVLKHYYQIPSSDLAIPAMSAWEYRQVRAELKKEGQQSVDQASILRTLTDLRSKVDLAQSKTTKARRQAQRRRDHENKKSKLFDSTLLESAREEEPDFDTEVRRHEDIA